MVWTWTRGRVPLTSSFSSLMRRPGASVPSSDSISMAAVPLVSLVVSFLAMLGTTVEPPPLRRSRDCCWCAPRANGTTTMRRLMLGSRRAAIFSDVVKWNRLTGLGSKATTRASVRKSISREQAPMLAPASTNVSGSGAPRVPGSSCERHALTNHSQSGKWPVLTIVSEMYSCGTRHISCSSFGQGCPYCTPVAREPSLHILSAPCLQV